MDPLGAPVLVTAAERQRLVRFCARTTGDAGAAEDLAQEALLRAHARRGTLGDQDRRWPWLLGIARHVCLDWIRQRRALRALPGEPSTEAQDPLDLDAELDRRELVALLDRAMDRLPPSTRSLLVDHYVEGWPQGALAVRHGYTTGAVAMRLQRGRDTLRDLLLTEFREDARELGLVDGETPPGWRPTRLWCDCCGSRRLRARFSPAWGIHLECPDCTRAPAVLLHLEGILPFPGMTTAAALFSGVRGVGRAVHRVAEAFHALLGNGLSACRPVCRACGHAGAAAWGGGPYADIQTRCPHCKWSLGLAGAGAVATSRPEFRHFLREHPRVRGLRPRGIEAAGTEALILGWESMTSADRIEFVYARRPMVLLRGPRTGEA